MWYLRPFNDKELIGRTYKIKYNTQEEVKYSGDSTAPTASTSGLGGTQSGSAPRPTSASRSPQDECLQGRSQAAHRRHQGLLGIPTTGLEGSIAKETTVDASGELAAPRAVGGMGAPDGGGKTAAGTSGGPQVIWNSDSNTLYVVATRQQHQWVEGYLNSMDRPSRSSPSR